MSEDRQRATAALCVSVSLLGLALAGRAPGPEPCRDPAERSSREGWTVAVRCAAGAERPLPLHGPVRLLFGLGLDPNRASPASLEALPGIGPARAAAIVEARAVAPICELADLGKIPGIGVRTLRKLSGLVRIDRFLCTGR